MTRDDRDDRATPGASAPEPGARGAFEVAPASLARSGSHRGPLVIALAVVAMVAVAIAKPWAGDDAGSGGPAVSGPAASSGVAGGVPTPSAPSAPPVIAWAEGDVFVAATPRSAWGIRAIVLPAGRESRPGGHALEDRWTAYDVDGGTADPAAPATAVGDGEAVIGLGVTTPPTVLPLDVRFWRIVPGGIPRRVVPQPLAGPDAGSWIWTPNPAEAAPNGAWPPGRYRVDVLTGPRVVELLAVVPGDEAAGVGPSPGAPSPLAPADLAAELRPLADGLFVVTGSGAAAVEGLPGDLLDARQAWFEPGVDRPRAAVGRVASEGVEAIGVILPAGAWAPRLAVRQVSPGFAWVVTRIETVPLEPSGVGGGPTAVAAHGGSGPFAPGVYELTARWQTATARPRAAVWHLEIVPRTPPTPPGSPLEALARWTGRADIPGAADAEALVTRRDLRPSGDTGTCGPNGGVTSSTSLLGLALPRGETVTDIRLIAPDGYTRIETRAMLPGADGLALVATRSGGFIPGRYRLDVTRRTPTGTAGRSYDVCFREP